MARKQQNLHLYNVALAAAIEAVQYLRRSSLAARVDVAGSLRRAMETVKNIHLVAGTNQPKQVIQHFVEYPAVQHTISQSDAAAKVALDSGIEATLHVVAEEQFNVAYAFFTGSKQHNAALQKQAKMRGLTYTSKGLSRGTDSAAPCKTEAEFYQHLALPWIAPELREDMGEFEADPLPTLVQQSDLKGLIHCHSTYSDGAASLEELAEAAAEHEYEYLVICDHSRSAVHANGLSPERVLRQQHEIDILNSKRAHLHILKGIESDILTDGSLDYNDITLDTFDIVIASAHDYLKMTEEQATARIIRAIEDPHTTIIGHPTGRMLLVRQGYPLDVEKVFDACIANRVALEINAHPIRLDLDWRLVRQGRDKGVLFSMDATRTGSRA